MVYVTHDQVEAMTLGDRIIVLNKGVIQQIDTPQNLYNKPANRFVASFIGSPAMNFIEGEVKKVESKLIFVTHGDEIQVYLDNQFEAYENLEIVLGVRPEHIYSDPGKLEASEKFTTSVQWTELLGHDGFAFFDINGKQAMVRLVAEELLNPPFQKILYLDTSKLHFFEKGSGNVIEAV